MKSIRFSQFLGLTCIAVFCFTSDAQAQFDIDWFTIDGGGGISSGSGFELEGTIGQFDAGQAMSGGGFTVTGGFWTGSTTAVLLGDINCDGSINLLDVAPFVDAISSGTFVPKADINQDGSVNLLDVSPFVDLLSGG